MTCREFVDFIMDYTTGELSDEVRRVFEEHLALCENCERYLGNYLETIKLGRMAFADDDTVPPEVPEELVAAILAARRARG